MGKSPLQILQQHQLRITKCRKDVLKTFLNRQVALTHGDLEEELKDDFDRVTIYRTLKTFLDADVVHKVLDDSGATKYALCTHSHEGSTSHHHDHVHFKCEKCGNTICIDEISLPMITLPEGFSKKEVSLLVQGVCDKCN
ncbi:Fur family transcriptional regulator [Mongoliitalea daihaiensis]|uniref:Fur family transcriptional regulator n=1 Tax=Mongoliitalea daihaiensis TaxID=2782006 RepID=UPI001F1D006A|nr:transcriptional repressor [Mongoliitalea daihaiensis]UJP65967.1 transcriptional repressor [Mongoliitalea daihaiensis]